MSDEQRQLRPPSIRYAPNVHEALAHGTPVVALETTLVSHGLPRPDNLDVVSAMSAAIEAEGAVAAAIGIVAGEIHIGLSRAQLEHFASDEGIAKASRRDLAVLMALGRDGATTVAATMACAALAGISVFATGGIGGVHRGAESTFDVSADLIELGRTPVAVVCSGAKTILDLAKTLEVLETQGVAVVGFATDSFPGFIVRDSGLPVSVRVDTPAQAARIVRHNEKLGVTGVLIANPLSQAVALEDHRVEAWVNEAMRCSEAMGVKGKSLTPFLLQRVAELSDGQSLRANKALLLDNAQCAAQIAVALAELRNAESL